MHNLPEHIARDARWRSSGRKSLVVEPCRTLRLARRFDARPQRVFNAWLDPPFAAQWLFATASRPLRHVEIDARVGHAFRFVDRDHDDAIEYAGEYTEIVPNRRLAFTLVLPHLTRAITRVSIAIGSVDEGTRLRLVHEDLPGAHASHLYDRWTGILYGLGVTLAADEHGMARNNAEGHLKQRRDER